MQARGLLNYRLKYCWPKIIYCICQPNELEGEITKKLGGQAGGQAKILGGHGPPRFPLESPLNIADDAMRVFVHRRACPFYTTKKMPHVTVIITNKHFVVSNSQVYYITTIYTARYLQICNAGHFFSSRHCHDL